MRLKRLINRLIIQVLVRLIVTATSVLAAVGITLVVMMGFVTVGTIFSVSLPYQPITALVAILALVAITIINVVFSARNKRGNKAETAQPA